MKHELKVAILKAAVNKWGIVNQMFMVMEECGELLNVLAKANRKRVSNADIITELADVSIMIEQMAVYFGASAFRSEKERKLERLRRRLEI